ncbi:MAG: c(7)-type cytochrome triheme domain-containing protein [Planctomycetota bacterium]
MSWSRGRGVLLLLVIGSMALCGLVLGAALQAGTDKSAGAAAEESNIVWVVKDKKQRYSALFRHDSHAAAGIQCEGCHDKIFKKETGAKFSMKDVFDGKACGVCHNKAPAADVKGSFQPLKNCTRCHSVLMGG